MPGIVAGIGEADPVGVVYRPDQRGVDAVAVRIGQVGRVHLDGVQGVVVAVEVPARAGGARGALQPVVGLGQHREAAAVRQDVLGGRVEGEDQVVQDVVLELAPDVPGVRGVDPDIVVVGAAADADLAQEVHEVGLGIVVLGSARHWRRTRAARVILEPVAVLAVLGKGHVAVEGIPVLVVVEGDAGKVAVVAEGLEDPGVVLGLLELTRSLELVVLGVGTRDEGAGPEGADLAGVQHGEEAAEVEASDLAGHLAADVRLGTTGDVVDGAAGGGGRRAIHVGGAEVHFRPLDQLGVELLVGVDGVVAAVVQLGAVPLQGDPGTVEAAQAHVAARVTVAVRVIEVIARDDVQGVGDRLAGHLLGDEVLADGDLGLRSRLLDQALDGTVLGACDDDFLKGGRARGLRHRRAGDQEGGHQGAGSAQTPAERLAHLKPLHRCHERLRPAGHKRIGGRVARIRRSLSDGFFTRVKLVGTAAKTPRLKPGVPALWAPFSPDPPTQPGSGHRDRIRPDSDCSGRDSWLRNPDGSPRPSRRWSVAGSGWRQGDGSDGPRRS